MTKDQILQTLTDMIAERLGPAPSNDFSWALKQMKQGRSVRRSCWAEGRSISIDRRMFVDRHFELVLLKTSDLVANDWLLTSSGPKVK